MEGLPKPCVLHDEVFDSLHDVMESAKIEGLKPGYDTCESILVNVTSREQERAQGRPPTFEIGLHTGSKPHWIQIWIHHHKFRSYDAPLTKVVQRAVVWYVMLQDIDQVLVGEFLDSCYTERDEDNHQGAECFWSRSKSAKISNLTDQPVQTAILSWLDIEAIRRILRDCMALDTAEHEGIILRSSSLSILSVEPVARAVGDGSGGGVLQLEAKVWRPSVAVPSIRTRHRTLVEASGDGHQSRKDVCLVNSTCQRHRISNKMLMEHASQQVFFTRILDGLQRKEGGEREVEIEPKKPAL